MDGAPCTSGAAPLNSNKRKQPDGDEVLSREGPLTADPIENEYEHLSGDDASDEEGLPDAATHLKKSELEQILKAQEPATVRKIDGIKVTPFNLKDELQEGEFDKAGNFVFRKRQNLESEEEENDTWAESIDWDEVERREEEAAAAAAAAATREASTLNNQQMPPDLLMQSESELPKDKLSCYKAMLRLMKPDEIVKKTIQRLGEGLPKRKPMNKNKKQPSSDTRIADQSAVADVRLKLDLMIELAHQRLQDGDTDIYQKTYEDLEEAINC